MSFLNVKSEMMVTSALVSICGTPSGSCLLACSLPTVFHLLQLLHHLGSTCLGKLLRPHQIWTLSGNALVFHTCCKCSTLGTTGCLVVVTCHVETEPIDVLLVVATPPFCLEPGDGLPLLGLLLCTAPMVASGLTALHLAALTAAFSLLSLAMN